MDDDDSLAFASIRRCANNASKRFAACRDCDNKIVADGYVVSIYIYKVIEVKLM